MTLNRDEAVKVICQQINEGIDAANARLGYKAAEHLQPSDIKLLPKPSEADKKLHMVWDYVSGVIAQELSIRLDFSNEMSSAAQCMRLIRALQVILNMTKPSEAGDE